MDRNDRSYKRAEEHYKNRTELYEDRENKIFKQRGDYKNNKQRRFNLLFVLPVILLATILFPKIMKYCEDNGLTGGKNPLSVKEIINYLEFSKSMETSTAEILKKYTDGDNIDTDAVQAQMENINLVFNELSETKVPEGFEEYNEYELYILATDIELLKVLCAERTPDMENYFNTMVQRRNSLAGHRRDCMKALLDNINEIKYTETENGISIEYYY